MFIFSTETVNSFELKMTFNGLGCVVIDYSHIASSQSNTFDIGIQIRLNSLQNIEHSSIVIRNSSITILGAPFWDIIQYNALFPSFPFLNLFIIVVGDSKYVSAQSIKS